MRIDFTAGTDDHDRRLESVLRRLLPHQSLGALHKALRKGDIRLNGAKAAPEARVAAGDTVAVWDALTAPPTAVRSADPIPRDWVLFDGEDLAAVNKPSGLLVHSGEGPSGGLAPLDERVRAWLAPMSRANLSFRPGPLHRLDRETSGIVVFSKTLVGARTFSQAVADRRVTKTYLAVLTGDLRETIETRVALTRDEERRTTVVDTEGADAATAFLPLAWAPGLTLAEVDLGTGRTHQIRVHAQSAGHPLAGDAKYGGGPTPAGLGVPWLLHAWKLRCALLPDLRAAFSEETASWLKKMFKFLG